MPDQTTPKAAADDQSERDKHVASVDYAAVIKESKLYGDLGAVEINMPDGSVFVLPGPMEWPRAFVRWQAEAAAGTIARDPDAAVIAMLGADEAERFYDHGGSPLGFMAVFDKNFGNTGESSAS